MTIASFEWANGSARHYTTKFFFVVVILFGWFLICLVLAVLGLNLGPCTC
jgi:hypothetical protein